MKVLYILHATSMSGATISFINMISGLKNMGVDIYITVPAKDLVFYKRLQGIVSQIYVVPIAASVLQRAEGEINNRFLAFIINCIRLFLAVVRKIRSLIYLFVVVNKVNPDIIHTNTGIIHEGYRISKMFSKPHVWHLREFQDKDFHWQILPTKKVFIHRLKQSYVISITNEIHKSFELDVNSKHHVIYNGIFSLDSCVITMPKKKYFLCASRISPEKGLKDVILSYSEFHKNIPEYDLIILGDGNEDYVSELKQIVINSQCSDHVHFMGHIDDIKPYMKEALALIVASYNEGFGRMTAEACFLGTLVIGRDSGGTKEILDYTGGLKFNSSEELLEMMFAAASMDISEYKKMVEYSQDKARAMYSVENNISSVYNFYKSIIEE